MSRRMRGIVGTLAGLVVGLLVAAQFQATLITPGLSGEGILVVALVAALIGGAVGRRWR
jgi:hypothetical protein